VNSDLHERARLLIAISGPGVASGEEQLWLASHLETCSSCREFAERSREAIQALRAIPIMAGTDLVSATKLRVRRRADELHFRQERVWVISTCCVVVTLWSALTTATFWSALAWLGRQTRLSPTIWQIPFAVLCFMPGILAGIVLLARGTHLTDRNGTL